MKWNSRDAGRHVPIIRAARWVPNRLWADDAQRDALESIPQSEYVPLWCELVRGYLDADYLTWARNIQLYENALVACGAMPSGCRTFSRRGPLKKAQP